MINHSTEYPNICTCLSSIFAVKQYSRTVEILIIQVLNYFGQTKLIHFVIGCKKILQTYRAMCFFIH